MLDPKEEVRLGGTRAFPRGHSPRARASAHQIVRYSFFLETAEASRPAHALVPSVPQANLEHADFSLADMHIPSLEDMVAQDDGGLSWFVAHPRALAPLVPAQSRRLRRFVFPSSRRIRARHVALRKIQNSIKSEKKKGKRTG